MLFRICAIISMTFWLLPINRMVVRLMSSVPLISKVEILIGKCCRFTLDRFTASIHHRLYLADLSKYDLLSETAYNGNSRTSLPASRNLSPLQLPRLASPSLQRTGHIHLVRIVEIMVVTACNQWGNFLPVFRPIARAGKLVVAVSWETIASPRCLANPPLPTRHQAHLVSVYLF